MRDVRESQRLVSYLYTSGRPRAGCSPWDTCTHMTPARWHSGMHTAGGWGRTRWCLSRDEKKCGTGEGAPEEQHMAEQTVWLVGNNGLEYLTLERIDGVSHNEKQMSWFTHQYNSFKFCWRFFAEFYAPVSFVLEYFTLGNLIKWMHLKKKVLLL